ncbi:hypothetical protein DL93DRAFT_1237613 [Clavulina sp. PMI_390]|nr:hypothetical protein DL93DRAFT_1237613 [Clavulina sp. PMI_390]
MHHEFRVSEPHCALAASLSQTDAHTHACVPHDLWGNYLFYLFDHKLDYPSIRHGLEQAPASWVPKPAYRSSETALPLSCSPFSSSLPPTGTTPGRLRATQSPVPCIVITLLLRHTLFLSLCIPCRHTLSTDPRETHATCEERIYLFIHLLCKNPRK